MTSPYLARLELEVKFLQLRVEVLQSDSSVTDALDLMPYQRLDLLLQQLIATGYAKESSRKICLTIDELLVGLREKAAKRQMEKHIAESCSAQRRNAAITRGLSGPPGEGTPFARTT